MSEPQATTIRAALATDIVAIARVRVAAWRVGYRGWVPDCYLDRPDFEEWERMSLQTNFQTMAETVRISVVERAGHIIGYCAYGSDDAVNRRSTQGSVYDLFIHPDWWRCGVGGMLLSYATTFLSSQGFSAASLFVYEANGPGRAFYHRMGWKPDGYRVVVLACNRHRLSVLIAD